MFHFTVFRMKKFAVCAFAAFLVHSVLCEKGPTPKGLERPIGGRNSKSNTDGGIELQ